MDLWEDDEPDAPGNAPEFTVSELSGAVKRVVEGAFDHVRVKGEVGRVFPARSGHLYFDLKDDRSVLAAVSWKGQAARLAVKPEEGMEVVATGQLGRRRAGARRIGITYGIHVPLIASLSEFIFRR